MDVGEKIRHLMALKRVYIYTDVIKISNNFHLAMFHIRKDLTPVLT